ncbi:MAG TPA: excinuclease ABC subunit UvrA [Steroidobacteraceae bacterium]
MNQANVVKIRGAREHNLKNVSVDVPRDCFVAFSGISGSGKSSLAFGTIYAEAQRRYFESVSPYARRLIDQLAVPDVDSIEGLPPAIALQQQRGASNPRSTVGSVSTLSHLLRMLFSRAGDYPRGLALLYAEDFSPNTPQGACPNCHGLGQLYDVSEQSMVPNDRLSIRERAIAAWPPAWHGQNLRDILVSLGYDVDVPWHRLPKKQRDWILYTEEQPRVPVYAGYSPAETRRALKRKEEPSYLGTFTGVRKYVLETYRGTHSAVMKKRVTRFLSAMPCPVCHGKRLKPEALRVRFGGEDIAALSHVPLSELSRRLSESNLTHLSDERRVAAERLIRNLVQRIGTLDKLGLGYLFLDRTAPTLSPGESQRLRMATQMSSNLFGVVYVLDEPSAGLHPADTEALLEALQVLRSHGNSLFVIEHDLDILRRADWLIDVGPGAGEEGGEILYSGPPQNVRKVAGSATGQYLFKKPPIIADDPRPATGWLKLRKVTRNNLSALDVDIPLGVFAVVSGVSGAGKSSLLHALIDLLHDRVARERAATEAGQAEELPPLSGTAPQSSGELHAGGENVTRVVSIDQRPIGRTPRSNLATYTGLFDEVRRLFAATPVAKAHRFGAGRFSFNVSGGRCPRCEGEGFVSVELLFMPSVYSPCPVCHGARYNEATLQAKLRGKNIAEVLGLSVRQALEFFAAEPSVQRPLKLLNAIGLGYLRLGQPATELSGGEAQRIKLATELQRVPRGATLYVIDEPTIGLHAADIDLLLLQLNALVHAGNSVLVAEHDTRILAQADWVIDLGPGAGNLGGRIVAAGTPAMLAENASSKTGIHLAKSCGRDTQSA